MIWRYFALQHWLKIMKDSNEQFLQYRLLAFKFGGQVSQQLGDVLESAERGQEPTNYKEILSELRNVCAKLPVSLVDRLDETLHMLALTKRDFIELAIIDALDKVDRLEKEIDVWEFEKPAREVNS